MQKCIILHEKVKNQFLKVMENPIMVNNMSKYAKMFCVKTPSMTSGLSRRALKTWSQFLQPLSSCATVNVRLSTRLRCRYLSFLICIKEKESKAKQQMYTHAHVRTS